LKFFHEDFKKLKKLSEKERADREKQRADAAEEKLHTSKLMSNLTVGASILKKINPQSSML
jgi:hypothetical protein